MNFAINPCLRFTQTFSMTTCFVLAAGLACPAMSQTSLPSQLQSRDADVPPFGEIMALGDLNGDGREDLAIGVPAATLGLDAQAKGPDGLVYLVLRQGHAQPSIQGINPPLEPARDGKASFGQSVEIRDVNGDGRLDLLIGEPNSSFAPGLESGLVWIYRAKNGGWESPVPMNSEDFARKGAPLGPNAPESGRSLLSDPEQSLLRLREECSLTPALPWEQMSTLQKHITFFDVDGDGGITLAETYRGLRDLGINAALSAPSAIAINAGLAIPTSRYPTLTIDLQNIAAGMHGSDTGIYNAEGEFVPEVFHRWFQRWDRNGDGALDIIELTRRWYTEADLFDFVGVIASGGEFSALYLIAAENGKISEERMRGLYDGSLFYAVAEAQGTLGCRPPFNGNELSKR